MPKASLCPALGVGIGPMERTPCLWRSLPPRKSHRGGTIDRVDLYVDPQGQRFVRIIDYKTGRKTFRLADALYGLNMQMLVYLAALVENGQEFPAGILYMPAAEPSVSVDRGTGEDKIKAEADKQLKMSGLVLSDQEIIQAMEAGAKGGLSPAS